MADLIEDLFTLNCYYNYQPDKEGLCHSTVCSMNIDPVSARDIAERGCRVYRKYPDMILKRRKDGERWGK